MIYTGIFGGMLSATLLGIFFVPLFFVLVQERKPKAAEHNLDVTDNLAIETTR